MLQRKRGRPAGDPFPDSLPCGDVLVSSFRSSSLGLLSSGFHAGTGGFSAVGNSFTGGGSGIAGSSRSGVSRGSGVSGGVRGRFGSGVGFSGFFSGRLAGGDRQSGNTDGSDEELADDHDAFLP